MSIAELDFSSCNVVFCPPNRPISSALGVVDTFHRDILLHLEGDSCDSGIFLADLKRSIAQAYSQRKGHHTNAKTAKYLSRINQCDTKHILSPHELSYVDVCN